VPLRFSCDVPPAPESAIVSRVGKKSQKLRSSAMNPRNICHVAVSIAPLTRQKQLNLYQLNASDQKTNAAYACGIWTRES
jgi:hypothetical protein